MTSDISLSIVLSSSFGEHHLPRIFQSLAWQTANLARVEVVFVHNGLDNPATRHARSWAGVLPGPVNFLNLPPSTRTFHAANLGLDAARGELVMHPPASVRLDPYFVEDALHQFKARKGLDVLYSDFVDLGEAAAGLVQLPRFAKWRLRARNVIGPLAVYRKKSLQALPGLRPDTPFQAWDLAVQAALRGLSFQRMDKVSYACSLLRPEPDEARQGAAMVVVNNQGFFRKEVVRWALAATRRSPWALRADPYRIPVAREVRQLMNDHVNEENGQRQGWLWRFTGPPAGLGSPLPVAVPVYDE